jgi:membrane protease YdiL (CAAX protease family)
MLRRLSPRGEWILINLICFGPFAAESIALMLRRQHTFVYDDARLLKIVGVEIVCGLLAWGVLRARGWKFSDFELRPSFLQAMGGMLLLIVANVTTAFLYSLSWAATGVDTAKVTTYETHTTWLPVLLLVLVNPLYEELFEVAYNLKATEGNGAAFAITFSSGVRFVCHLYQGPIAAVTILPLGIVFALVYWRWRKLWPLVVAHGAADLIGLWPR